MLVPAATSMRLAFFETGFAVLCRSIHTKIDSKSIRCGAKCKLSGGIVLHVYLAFMLSGLHEIISSLHAQPGTVTAAESLFESDGHVRRNPCLAIDDTGQDMTRYSKCCRPFRNRQFQGSRQASLMERPGCGGFFIGMVTTL